MPPAIMLCALWCAPQAPGLRAGSSMPAALHACVWKGLLAVIWCHVLDIRGMLISQHILPASPDSGFCPQSKVFRCDNASRERNALQACDTFVIIPYPDSSEAQISGLAMCQTEIGISLET